MNGDKVDLEDTSNWFLARYDAQRDLLFTALRPDAPLNRAMALNAAAWIVALVDPEKKRFDPLLEAIKKS